MTPIEAFLSRSNADATLSGKIAGIYPSPYPQEKGFPGVSYIVAGEGIDNRLSDVGNNTLLQLQINVLSYTYSDLSSIESDIKRLWGGYAGTISDVVVIKSKITDVNDIPGAREPGSERVIYQRSIDLTIKHEG